MRRRTGRAGPRRAGRPARRARRSRAAPRSAPVRSGRSSGGGLLRGEGGGERLLDGLGEPALDPCGDLLALGVAHETLADDQRVAESPRRDLLGVAEVVTLRMRAEAVRVED